VSASSLRRLLGLIVLTSLLGLASASADIIPLSGAKDKPEKRSPELIQAEKLFNQGEFDKALEQLEAACKKDAELSPAPLLLARLFLSRGQGGAARTVLERAVSKQPSHPAFYLAFAQLNLAEGRLTEAAVLIEKTLALCDSNKEIAKQKPLYQREAFSGRAFIAEQRQEWETARQALAEWLKVDPKNGPAHQRMGRALFFLDKPTEALAELQQAHALEPTLEHPAVSMGLMWTQKKDPKQADTWMQRALKEDSKTVRTRLAVAAWLLDQGRADEAAIQADAALRTEPASVDVRRLRGLIARHQRNFIEAEKLFEPLYQESPADFFICNQLALALAEQADGKKLRRALQLAEVNARQYPNASEAGATLGRIYYLLGRWDDAERALQAAARTGQLSADAAYYFASVLDQLKKPDDAQKLLKAAVETQGAFLFRKEAKELLARLEKRKP
jgi:tetratricopeptide (TPR) repeat protein